MAGAETLAAPRIARYRERLDEYLGDALRLVGADGCPLIQGRSLVYRFAAAAPFQDGVQCVALPVRRTGSQSSGGNVGTNDCSGVYSLDFNARIQSGVDPSLVPGVQVNGQFWTRDSGVPSGTGLSDAIEFVIQA